MSIRGLLAQGGAGLRAVHVLRLPPGVNPYENLLSPGNVAGLKVAWATQAGAPIGDNSPVVFNGRVYITNQAGTLFALRESDGALLWSAATTGGDTRSAPAIYHGHVYVSVDGGTLPRQAWPPLVIGHRGGWALLPASEQARHTPRFGVSPREPEPPVAGCLRQDLRFRPSLLDHEIRSATRVGARRGRRLHLDC